MANWVIRGTSGFPDTPFYEVGSATDVSGIMPLSLDPVYEAGVVKEIYNANGGSISTYLYGGTQPYIAVREMAPSTTTHGAFETVVGTHHVYVFAYSFPYNDNYVQRVLWFSDESAAGARLRIINGNWDENNVLYNVLNADNPIPDFVVEDREWDETPSEDQTDPDNLDPQGGENADLGVFSETDLMSISGMPNPASTMDMSFGSFVTCYSITALELGSIGQAMFVPSFWSGLKQKFEGLTDPLSCILACHQIPFSVTGSAGSQFQIGGVVPELNGNPVTTTRTSTRYVKNSLGSITLKEIFGSDKDYSHVSIDIFLPYVGMKSLDPDLVVGNKLTLVSYVDIWTGDLLYLLHVSNADRSKKYFTAESVPYRWAGNCSKTIPVGRFDNSRVIMNMISTIGSIGLGAGIAGAGALGLTGGAAALGTSAAGATMLGPDVMAMAQGSSLAAGKALQAASSGFSPTAQSSSGIGGSVGMMDYQKAYLVVKRGVPKYPNGWRDLIGAPQYQTYNGTSCSGYTVFSEIHLPGVSGLTDAEMAELERELKTEGVIL